MPLKICKVCNNSLEIEYFRLHGPVKLASGKKKRYRSHICKSCVKEANKKRCTPEQIKYWNDLKKERRREQKKLAVLHLGGVCSHCGGNFHHSAFDFHHTNPEEKEIEVGLLMQCNKEKLFEELGKCILLCANCHRILHYGS